VDHCDVDASRLERLTALGLYDGCSADRLALLEMLVDEGFTDDEMRAANLDGRLFALAGDRIAQGSAPAHTTESAASALGLTTSELGRVWQAVGLPAADDVHLTEAEVEGLGVLRDVAALLGINAAVDVARVIGTAMARVAEAESSAVRRAVRDVDLGLSQSEPATAAAWRATAELIPRMGRLLEVIHRRHLMLVRPYFESIAIRGQGAEATLGVGFVDLSGFTALSATTSLPSLSRLLSVFEERASDTVLAGGGRLVKFLGDAVMFVSADRGTLARIALDLVADPIAEEAGISVRGGIAWGDVLVQDGDYFGSPVNLAARLVALAAPGTVLGSAELAEVEGATAEVLAPQTIRGFEAPVAVVLLSG
jgi:class 3 adenylate cyclase